MTMPHLENCAHLCDGWCLACVKKLHARCDLNAVLESLGEWECRKDHDVGPGLHIQQAWLQLFCDGSGAVVLELATVARVDEYGVKLAKFLTNIGAEGTIEKRFPFDTLNDAFPILNNPVKLSYEK